MYKNIIKQAAIKYSRCPYLGIRGLKAQSKLYPDGERQFWSNERYKRIEKIKTETLFLGDIWTNSGCPDIVSIHDFIDVLNDELTRQLKEIYSINQNITDSYIQSMAIKEIDSFFKYSLEFRAIDAIIKNINDSERKYSDKKEITFSELFNRSHLDKLTEFKILLHKKGYLDGIDHKNVLAKLYYWLIDNKAITQQSTHTKPLTCFYAEFNIIVYKDSKNKPKNDNAVEIKTLRARPNDKDEDRFFKDFGPLFGMKE